MTTSNTQPSPRRFGKDLALISSAAFCLSIGMGIYAATYYNFAVGVIGMRPEQNGILEALRECPGFAMAFVLALAMRVAEPKLATSALILIAVGFLGYSRTTTFPPLVAYSVLWSVGLHIWMPLSSAMTLSLSDEHEKGKRLGQVAGWGGLGTMVGLVLVLFLNTSISYGLWYTVAAATFMVGAIAIWFVRRDLSPPDKPRMVIKRKYALYYGLTFLEGCRKQVFITFAVYALVHEYGTPQRIVAILMIVNNTVNLIGAPIVGRWIDKIGERRILTFSYACLVFVFLGYGLIRRVEALYVLYCLDNLLYLSTYCLTTFLSRIAEERDMVPSLSMGVTMNHLAAVTVPLIGGLMWAKFGYRDTFIGGAVVVLISLVLTQRMRPAAKHPPTPGPGPRPQAPVEV
jgi:MFS family permease